MIRFKRLWISVLLTCSFLNVHASSLKAIQTDAAPIDDLPAPTVYSEPDFNFLDCHGKPFNTKEIQYDQTNDESTCSVQGIVNTTFEFGDGVKGQKSVLELTQSEKNHVLNNLGEFDPKAVFALFVYMTVSQLPEYHFLLDKDAHSDR